MRKRDERYKNNLKRDVLKNWDLYLLFFPVLLYFILFHYWPMYGVQIAFKDFVATKGIKGSPWAGFRHFQRFFRSHHFWPLIRNTLGLSIYQLLASFPAPIILALLINEVMNNRFKRTVQTVTYAPHFLSTVVVVGMMTTMLSPQTGIINKLLQSMGKERIYFMGESQWFRHLYVWSGVWQHTGWNAIIYLAALSGINIELHEAAIVDGASKLERIWYINIPGILPTAIVLLILNLGQVMNVGFEKVFLMQNDLNISTSNVISTYVYNIGLLGSQYSFSTAVGLFNSIINFILLIAVNKISREVTDVGLW